MRLTNHYYYIYWAAHKIESNISCSRDPMLLLASDVSACVWENVFFLTLGPRRGRGWGLLETPHFWAAFDFLSVRGKDELNLRLPLLQIGVL